MNKTTLASLAQVAAAHGAGMSRADAFTAYYAGLPAEALAGRLGSKKRMLAEAQAAQDPRLQDVYERHIDWMKAAQSL